MFRHRDELAEEKRESVRGGAGRALLRHYLSQGDMAGVNSVSVVTLDPGASVGEHRHEGTEEFYLLLEGRGTGFLDGDPFEVGPGDAFLVREGYTHGLANGPSSPLVFLAILTKKASS